MAIEDPGTKPHPPSALPRGTRLGEFELRHVLGIGGFGIVYLAFDHALEREVAVKEYLPDTLVGRTETLHVSLRSQSDAETFALGLKSFVNEARLLAHFDHPSLLKVLRFWEANGTAYMAMPVLRGHTVKQVRLHMKEPPDEAWMRALLDPLLGAIERLHAEGVYHRDIAPDNIQIEPDGHPVLLDFGAARRVISDKTQSLTAILKPAYAPIEQYAEAGSVKQGPWTDLYALGATMHFVLLGRPPLPATARAVHDDLAPLSARDVPGCSAEFLNVIDWMLAPRPADRPQSVAALRDVLAGRAPAPRRRVDEPVSPGSWERTIVHSTKGAAPVAAAEVTQVATMLMPRRDAPAPAADVSSAQDSPADGSATPAAQRSARQPATGEADAPRSRLVPMLLGVAVLAAAGLAAVFGLRSGGVAPSQAAASAPDVALMAAGAASSTAVAASAPEALLPPAAQQPTSSVATVTVGAAAGNALPADKKPATARPDAAAPGPAGPQARATAPAGAPARALATTPTPAPGVAPVVPPAGTGQAAVAEQAQPARAPVAAPTPAAPAPAAPAAQESKPIAAGPEATCAGRNQLAYFVCMERECLRSELAANQHPECRKWRAARPADSPTY